MAICQVCGEENPDRAKFCLNCASPLVPAGDVPEAEERKVVSVLFADLVGFTSRSDDSDPEDVRAILRPYHAALKREIERYGGTVEKFIGDAAMGVFGAPVAHEDDPERAVRAALRIQDAIDELNEATSGLALSVRAAVNTGEALVTLGARPELGEGMVAGDVVNTASRLQTICPEGGVVVGEATYRATADLFDYRPLEAVSVKGKVEPVPIWLARAARGGFGVDVRRGFDTPHVGREDELELLRRTFARTLREPSVQLVTVTGEPGVGKSRLVAEFFRHIDDLTDIVYWRQGRCLPYGEGVTFWALGEVVKAQAGILESDPPAEASAKLDIAVQAVLESGSDRDWVRSRLAPLVGLVTEGGDNVDRAEAFAAWRRFLEAVASRSPLVLVFEDLHWADTPLLEFIDHLVEYATDVPMLVLCTARPELYERDAGWGGGKRNSTAISLTPLTEAETGRLVAGLLSDVVLPEDVQRELLERAGGNPLYAEEFVRMLTDAGLLLHREGIMRLAQGATIPVPDTVQALIAARLDTVPAGRKVLLHDASVVGKVFWSGALSAMGSQAEDTVRDGLHELGRKELVRSARTSSVKDQDEYSFWHVLVRDVAYSQIPRGARAAKHRAAAAWIEEIAGERVADHAELLAYHYALALELSRASGALEEAKALEGAAARFLEMAGDRALHLDVPKAAEYYRRALELVGPGGRGRGRFLAKSSQTSYLLGGLSEARDRAEEAVAEARREGDRRTEGNAMVHLTEVLADMGQNEASRTMLAGGLAVVEEFGPGPELALAYSLVARDRALAGLMPEALEWADKALALGREHGPPSVTVRSLQYRGMARIELGEPGGVDDVRAAVDVAAAHGLGWEVARALNNLAEQVWFDEGPVAGLRMLDEGIAIAEQRGDVFDAAWITGSKLYPLFDLGRWDEALRLAEGIMTMGQGGQIAAMGAAVTVMVLGQRGESERAAPVVERWLPTSRAIGDPQMQAPSLAAAARVRYIAGDAAAARGIIEELEAVLATGVWSGAAVATLDGVRLALAMGERGLAERLLATLTETTARNRIAGMAARAMVAEARGDLQEALAGYEDAERRWAEYGQVLERAHAQFGRARCLASLGRSAEAAGPLAAAREVFESLGARPLVAETDAWLARAGGAG